MVGLCYDQLSAGFANSYGVNVTIMREFNH